MSQSLLRLPPFISYVHCDKVEVTWIIQIYNFPGEGNIYFKQSLMFNAVICSVIALIYFQNWCI